MYIHIHTHTCDASVFGMAYAGKMYKGTHEVISTSRVVAITVAHACSLFLAVSMSDSISGGHVNPAVTFGALVAGRISLHRASLYCLAQLFGSVVASLLLRIVIIAGPVNFSQFKKRINQQIKNFTLINLK